MQGDNRTKPFSDKLIAWLLVALALVCNEVTIPFFQGRGWLPQWPATSTHEADVRVHLPRVLFLALLSLGLVMRFSKRSVATLFRDGIAFNLLLLALSIALMLVINPIAAGQMMLVRVALLLILFFFLLKCLYLTVVARKEQHPVMRNVLLSGYALLFIFFLLEGVFMWLGKPHHQNDTLTSRVWFARHWSANELGYRDRPITAEGGSRKVLVIGDSFGAGHGVKDMRDRFGEQLEQQLGEGWRVYNACYPGLDTRKEFEGLQGYPVKPDYVVLQWYPNDIERPALEHGHPLAGVSPEERLATPLRFLVGHSYVLNYLFWLNPKDERIDSYAKFTQDSFADPKVLEGHQRDIGKFVEWCRQRQVPLAVVVFPFLGDPEGSRYTTAPVRAYFESVQVPVVDVGDLVKGMPVQDLVVNDADGHASVKVHHLVGEELHKVFVAKGWE